MHMAGGGVGSSPRVLWAIVMAPGHAPEVGGGVGMVRLWC